LLSTAERLSVAEHLFPDSPIVVFFVKQPEIRDMRVREQTHPSNRCNAVNRSPDISIVHSSDFFCGHRS
jgi:hypothetical protein